MSTERTSLAGWANTAPSAAMVLHPTTIDEMAAALAPATVGDRGIIARGLGRSYGDPAQNAGGTVIDATAVRGINHLDLEQGLVTADAGTSLDDLMRWLVPLGWFVPVTPGTRQVTVGGAIASDIHGKNHHKVGSWCSSVEALTIVTPLHGKTRITADSAPDLFWATAGGMGLTGVILDATIRLKKIETSRMVVDTDRTDNLDQVISKMTDEDHKYDYSVAWIDLMATGTSVGRSILDRGRFAQMEELNKKALRDPLAFSSGTIATFPPIPVSLVGHTTIKTFNEAWYRKAPRQRREHLQTISQFFHPLDLVERWNRVYGTTGLLQWQFVIPLDATDTLRQIVHQLSNSGAPSFLAVLKRMGPGNDGHLSFPMEGWTLAFDVPASTHGDLAKLLDRLDEKVVEAGGRLYLAKDSRMRPELLEEMYPRLDQWRQIKASVDPNNMLMSDMGRRLGLYSK